MNWTTDAVFDLAPDYATAESGQALAEERKWKKLEREDPYIWGTLRSFGGSPYRTAVDLRSGNVVCNCRSRKSPCKHAIALLYLFSDHPESFQVIGAPPDWVLAAVGAPPEPASVPVDRGQREKSHSRRLDQMEGGLREFEQFLLDLIRQGLATTEAQGAAYWTEAAARLVDAKLGGVARQVRLLGDVYRNGLDWPEMMLHTVGQIYLLIRGFRQMDQLPEGLRRELLSVTGLNIKKEELQRRSGIRDEWIVLGQQHKQEEKLAVRRTWVHGLNTGREGLILEFAWGNAGFLTVWPVGRQFRGELIYYPFLFEQRVFVKDHSAPTPLANLPEGHRDFESFLVHFAEALARNPWLINYPGWLRQVRPLFKKDQLWIVDQNRRQLPVAGSASRNWTMIAISGGHPVDLFGEWNGRVFVPLSIWSSGRLQRL